LFRNDWDANINPLGLDEELMEDMCSTNELESNDDNSDGEVSILNLSLIFTFTI